MTPDRWQILKNLFSEAQGLSADEFAAFAARECGGDLTLRAELERLLVQSKQAGDFLEQPLSHLPPDALQGEGLELLQAGELVSDQFLVERLLGSGGMGSVYLATDKRLRRQVALKVLPEGLEDDSDRRQRFEREARAVASLKHPNICDVYQFGSDKGRDYIVLEYLNGVTLAERLRKGPLPEAEWKRVAIEISSALAYAHEKGVVHRDLKPGNIMLTEDGAKLLDFSLAKQLTPLRMGPGPDPAATVTATTEQGTIVGTVSYMSPEQAEGKPVDARSDVFSFGCVLYEMVAGRKAFEGDSRISTLAAILRGEPIPLPTLVPLAPPELAEIIEKCLRKLPEDRFQSVNDLKVGIESLNGKIAPARLAIHGASRAARRLLRPGAAGLLALFIVLLGAAWLPWWPTKRAIGPELAPPIAITTYRGVEEDATLSPDGTQVAFSGNVEVEDNFDIYVKVIGTDPPLRLTRDPNPDARPIWSPDQRWIAFERSGKLLLVSPLGGSEHIVGEGDRLLPCAWSHDGQNVIVVTRTDPGKPSSLFAVSIATGERKLLVREADWPCAISHDGRMLAYVQANPGTPRLYTAPLSARLEVGNPRAIDSLKMKAFGGCAWTARDRELVCSLRQSMENPPNLWRIDVGNQPAPEMLPFTGGGWGPTISGRKLVFDAFKVEKDTWRAPNPVHGSSTQSGVRFGSFTKADSAPQYSPDGTRIAFLSMRSGQRQVWMSHEDSSNPRMLTSLADAVGYDTPRWSGDSKWIAFGQNGNVYVIDSGGGFPRQVVPEPAMKAFDPALSHDGRWVYFTSDRTGRSEIWRVPVSGGAAVQITRNGGSSPLASPDGRFLFYLKAGPQKTEIWSMAPSRPDEGRPIVESVNSFGQPQFAYAASSLFYIRFDQPDRPIGIDLLDFDTGAKRRVLTINRPQRFCGKGLSVSPDSRWLLYTLIDFEDDLMMFEPF